MKNVAIVTLAGMLVGCAVASSGVIARGDNMYTVTRQGDGFWVSTDQLKNAAIQEAQASSNRDKKTLKVIHSKEIQAGAFGRWPEAEVLFKCE